MNVCPSRSVIAERERVRSVRKVSVTVYDASGEGLYYEVGDAVWKVQIFTSIYFNIPISSCFAKEYVPLFIDDILNKLIYRYKH